MENYQAIREQASPLLTPKPLQQLLLTVNEPLANLISDTGLNELVSCAAPLLAIMTQLKRARLTGEIQALRQHLLQAVVGFEVKANQQHLASSTIHSARYILCAALDEIILDQQMNEQMPWDQHNDWSKQSLVNTFYQDAWGGEKFFEILDHMLSAPEQNLDMLELICFCLQLGFAGKYRIMEQGTERLALLREKLYTSIYQRRANPVSSLTPQRKPVSLQQRMANPFVLVIFTGILLTLAVADLYLFFNHQLNTLTEQIYASLQLFIKGA
jgi:type VI secretion system protein ImpK